MGAGQAEYKSKQAKIQQMPWVQPREAMGIEDSDGRRVVLRRVAAEVSGHLGALRDSLLTQLAGPLQLPDALRLVSAPPGSSTINRES